MPKDVPPKVMRTFERLKESKPGYIELKEIKGRYYVYRSTSEWDKEKKKPVKKPTYLGAINLEGEYTPKKMKTGFQESKREVYEYGNARLAHRFLEDVEGELRQYTPHAEELIAAAIIRAIDPQPLRLHESRWKKLYLSTEIEAGLSPKRMSHILRDTGLGVEWWHDLFSALVREGDLLFYDLTAVFTYSQNIKLAEKGYNRKKLYLDQIGIVIAFSKENGLPAGLEVFWGSLKDISTLKGFLNRFWGSDFGFILDRGFWSETLLRDFKNREISYIAPLRKNSKMLDLRWVRWRKPFIYRDRPVRWGRRQTDLGTLYLFRDPKLRGEQKATLLKKVERGIIDMEEFEAKKEVAGIIGLISDMDRKGKEIYDLYKGRQDVELAFDAMKNTLDSDKTYLQSDEAVRGYFFVTFLALRVYFKILKRLRERDLTGKISVKEVLFELSKLQKIVEPNGREYFAKTPKQTKEIADIFPEALPMD